MPPALPPQPANESLRLDLLRRLRLVEGLKAPKYKRIVRLAASVLNLPMAFISIVEEHCQIMAATQGTDLRESRREDAFCNHVISSGEMMVVPDTHETVLFRNNPFVIEQPFIRFYAGAPLTLGNDVTVGTLCVIDTVPHHDFDARARKQLTELAAILIDEVEQDRVVLHYMNNAEEERRSLRDHLSAALSTSPLPVIAADLDDRIEIWNPAAERVFGWKEKDVIGKTSPHIQDSSDSATLIDAAHRGLTTLGYETRRRRRDGSIVDVSIAVAPLRGPEGDIRGILAIYEDITGRKAREWALRTALARAAHASRAKSAFLANMSHELRTPLNAIIGFSEALLEGIFGKLNSRHGEYVTDIHDAGLHLLDLIGSLLDLSRIEAGKMDLILGEVDLDEVMEDCLTIVALQAAKGGIEVVQEPGVKVPPVVGDRLRLKQVLLNLLSNAIKFTDPGGRVTVRLRQDRSLDAPTAVVEVEDTGVGMNPADIAEAMEVFGRVDHEIRRTEGIGLGLPLSRELVTLHGGSLEIRSAKNIGTTVTCRLPLDGPLCEI